MSALEVLLGSWRSDGDRVGSQKERKVSDNIQNTAKKIENFCP